MASGRCSRGRDDGVLVGDVGHDGGDGGAARGRLADLFGRVEQLLLGAPTDRDVTTLGGQQRGRAEPDAAPASGDES